MKLFPGRSAVTFLEHLETKLMKNKQPFGIMAGRFMAFLVLLCMGASSLSAGERVEPTIVLEFYSPFMYDSKRGNEVGKHLPSRTPQPLTIIIPAGNTENAVVLARPSSVGNRSMNILAKPLPKVEGTSVSREGNQLSGRLVTHAVRLRNKGMRKAFYAADFTYTINRRDEGRWTGQWKQGDQSGMVIGWEETAPTAQPTSCVFLIHGANELDVDDPKGSAGMLGLKQIVAHFAADGSLLSAEMNNGSHRMTSYGSVPAAINCMVTDDGRLLKGLTTAGKYAFTTTTASGSFKGGVGNVTIHASAKQVDKMGKPLAGKTPVVFQAQFTFTSMGRTLMGNGTGRDPKSDAITLAVQGRSSTVTPEAKAVTLPALEDDLAGD